MYNTKLQFLPDRPAKPRENGIVMVMDKGLSLRETEDLIDVSGDLIDFVKLGFGTSVVTPNVKEKVKLLRKANIKVYAGGTLFEAFIIRNKLEDYKSYVSQLGLDAVEVSDGSI